MRVVHTIAELRTHLAGQSGCSFVPTMGNLQRGHLSLVREARARGNLVVVSILVNPFQFAPIEDFDSYPRTFARDCELLRTAGCDVVFVPDLPELYPASQTFKMEPPARRTEILEGEPRPGFFAGVCAVVLKLLNCVRPRVVLFGKEGLPVVDDHS